MILDLKLKDQALKWFHTKPEHLTIPIHQLLEEMKNLFDHRPAKVELRREFESREWKDGESFSTYFYDKIILAARVPVVEEEIVDYVIDGIPDKSLQNQARMHRFDGKDELLRAFEQIKLVSERKMKQSRENSVVESAKFKQEKPVFGRRSDGKVEERRCFNCYQLGHHMKDCSKPIREKGTCFECGEAGHLARDCQQKKKKMSQSTEVKQKQDASQVLSVTGGKRDDCYNEYLKVVEFVKNNNGTNFCFYINTQMDTASPVSLIKENLIPREWMEKLSSESYEGLNGSTLEVKWGVTLKIICDNAVAESVKFRIVKDTAMINNALLGRDALRLLGFSLNKIPDKNESCLIGEILNIDSGLFKNSEIDKVKIKPDLPAKEIKIITEKIQNAYLNTNDLILQWSNQN